MFLNVLDGIWGTWEDKELCPFEDKEVCPGTPGGLQVNNELLKGAVALVE